MHTAWKSWQRDRAEVFAEDRTPVGPVLQDRIDVIDVTVIALKRIATFRKYVNGHVPRNRAHITCLRSNFQMSARLVGQVKDSIPYISLVLNFATERLYSVYYIQIGARVVSRVRSRSLGCLNPDCFGSGW